MAVICSIQDISKGITNVFTWNYDDAPHPRAELMLELLGLPIVSLWSTSFYSLFVFRTYHCFIYGNEWLCIFNWFTVLSVERLCRVDILIVLPCPNQSKRLCHVSFSIGLLCLQWRWLCYGGRELPTKNSHILWNKCYFHWEINQN